MMTDSEIMKEIEKMRLGPASHDPQFTLTERRADIGVFPEKPKRNRLVFKYMKPVERTVEGIKDEGRWVFYDVDLDAVRAELA